MGSVYKLVGDDNAFSLSWGDSIVTLILLHTIYNRTMNTSFYIYLYIIRMWQSRTTDSFVNIATPSYNIHCVCVHRIIITPDLRIA